MLPTFLVILYVIIVLATIYIMMKDYRHPSKAISWILVMLFIPFLGIFFYLVFGRNLRNKKLFSDHITFRNQGSTGPAASISPTPGLFEQESDWRLANLLSQNSNAPLTFGNEVKLLFDGTATYDAKCKALEAAKHHIHLEYYIFEPGEVAERFIGILSKKAKEGVTVRLLYDAVGSWNLGPEIENLKEAGVNVASFFPVRFPTFAQRFNYRNHRKILVVDGKIGFVGGLNITDNYLDKGKDGLFWRDTHLALTGDAVQGLQEIFCRDWHFATKSLMITGPAYFPEDSPNTGKHTVQIVSSGPDSQWPNLMHSYFYAVVSAQKKVYLSTPYFIPNRGMMTALIATSMAGIDIQILLPGKSDSKLLYWSMRSYLEELLSAGVRIFLYQPGINHGKTMCVDGRIASVGTANLDIRSFHQNFEVNALVYSTEITGQLENRFFEGIEKSRELTLEEFSKRPAWQKGLESFARLASPLL